MAIANLVNVPTDQKEMDDWTFIHMAHHRDVNAEIFRLFGVRIDEYVLDPVDPKAPGNFEDQHQSMHLAVNNVLGTGGFDLTNVDWLHPEILSGWVQSNYFEHRQWADALGVD
jgi:hypothetical protein